MNKYKPSLFLTVLTSVIFSIFLNYSAFSDQKSLLGEWKIQSHIATLNDGTQFSTPKSEGVLGFYENGVYVIRGGNDEFGGTYAVTKPNHIKFNNVFEIESDYPIFPYIQECQFTILNDKLTLIFEIPFEGAKRIEATFINISQGEKNVFKSPNLNGYQITKEWDAKTVKTQWINDDTHVIKHMNVSGDRVDKYISNNHVWGWMVISSNVKENFADLSKNYKIRDSNCNGIFDEKYTLEEAWSGSPACARWIYLP